MKIQKVLALIVISLVLLILLAGCAGPPDAAPSSGDIPNLVEASDQTVGDGVVTIDRVKLENAGFVVIRTDAAGSPSDTVVGSNRYAAGESTAVTFTLEGFDSLAAGANTLWAVLHQDAGTDSVFEFPGADTALANSDGTTVMDTFVLTK